MNELISGFTTAWIQIIDNKIFVKHLFDIGFVLGVISAVTIFVSAFYLIIFLTFKTLDTFYEKKEKQCKQIGGQKTTV
jgi:hypothetical protein